MVEQRNLQGMSMQRWNSTLRRLRRDGFSPVDSIKITRAVLDVELGEAKRIVHTSEAWADALEGFDELHDVAVEATDRL